MRNRNFLVHIVDGDGNLWRSVTSDAPAEAVGGWKIAACEEELCAKEL
jgi:hypothetical protein